jgi:general stress protein YciG
MGQDETKRSRTDAARLGGQAVVQQRGVEHMRALGQKGGKAVASRPGHMSTLGRKGAAARNALRGTQGRAPTP